MVIRRARRAVARGLVLATSVVLVCTFTRPALAAAPGDGLRQAVRSALSGYTLRRDESRTAESELDGRERVAVRTATFTRGRSRVLTVLRTVGATREVTPAQISPGARVAGRVPLARRGAGTRPALLLSTADRWGPGLTVLAWSERRGVNYHLIARGAVTPADLKRLAGALPKDSARASARARSLIGRAGAPDPGTVDRRPKAGGGVTAQNTVNLTVDGAGVAGDDLGNEATLCAGCFYSSGNYAGMWQLILYADNNLAYADVDCSFGSGTASATRQWQRAENLGADGIVGPSTRGRADNNLYAAGTDVLYQGAARTLSFHRSTSNYYYYYQSVRVSYTFGAGRIAPC